MSPLQRIGFGLILVFIPADFPAHPDPVWNYYDALPPPLGWLLVLSGVATMARTTDLDLRTARTAAVVAFLVSIPMWFPQVNHYIVPDYNPGVSESWRWLIAVPSWAFGFYLSKAIGDAAVNRETPERGMAGWFGILRWGFVAAAIVPLVVYGANVKHFDGTMHAIIGMVAICLIVGMFTYHRRDWLGGPGPREWLTPEQKEAVRAESRPEGAPDIRADWQAFKAEREKERDERRAAKQAKRQK